MSLLLISTGWPPACWEGAGSSKVGPDLKILLPSARYFLRAPENSPVNGVFPYSLLCLRGWKKKKRVAPCMNWERYFKHCWAQLPSLGKYICYTVPGNCEGESRRGRNNSYLWSLKSCLESLTTLAPCQKHAFPHHLNPPMYPCILL